MMFEKREHTTVLEWDPPPAIGDVEATLRAHIGQPLKGLGDLDV
jgi:hypothetical protein